MYSECDKLFLQILFVCFLALPSLLYRLIINCFLYLLLFFFIALRALNSGPLSSIPLD